MIHGGNATLFFADVDAAVRFYTEVLGLELRFRAGNHWAEVCAGKDLVIGIHPVGPNTPPPGVRGSIEIGLNVSEPLDDVMTTLRGRGVAFEGPVIDSEGVGRFAHFVDPGGHRIYLWEAANFTAPAN